MALFPPENALAFAHFALRGGWRKTATLLVGYVIIIGAAIVLTVQANPRHQREMLIGWTMGLLMIQGLTLVLFPAGRVANTIRQDITSRMIDSHRLMPMPPSHAIAGYIMGAMAQSVVMATATFLLGVLTSAGAGISFERWAMGNAILLGFAAFLCCASVFVGFLAKGAGAVLWLVIGVPWFTQGAALVILPGLVVLLSPLVGTSIFDLRSTWSVPSTFAVAAAAQFFFGAVFYVGAMRKYRRPDAPGLGTSLSFLLLVGWCAVSWIGIRQWEAFCPSWLRMQISTPVQIVASMISAMLVAMASFAALALENTRWRRRMLLKDPALPPRPVPWAVLLLAASLLIAMLGYAPTSHIRFQSESVLRSGIVLAAALAAIFFLSRWCYRIVSYAWIPTCIWMFITWLIPLLLDFGRFALSSDPHALPLSVVSTFSPVGALIRIWTDDPATTTFPIATQLCIASIPVLLDLLTRPRRRQRSGAALAGAPI